MVVADGKQDAHITREYFEIDVEALPLPHLTLLSQFQKNYQGNMAMASTSLLIFKALETMALMLRKAMICVFMYGGKEA